MKKKFGAVVMAGIMACTMTVGIAFTAGCGKSRLKADFVMPDGGFDTSKDVNIKFYHTMGATNGSRQILQTYIGKFNELYPNIHIEEQQVGGYNEVRDQINNEIIAGDQPNIAYCYPDHVATFNLAGAVQPLNDFLSDSVYKDMEVTRADGTKEKICLTEEQTADYIQSYYNEGFQFDDGSTMYTLPFSKSTEVLYYNKKFFKDHDLTPPTTWKEMEKLCADIKAIDPDCVPFGYDSESNWFITMCEQLGSDYTSATGKKYRFDNETNRDFVQRFKEWKDKGYFTTRELNNQRYTSTLFVESKSYMSIGSSAGATNQRPERVQGEYPFEVGIVPIPQEYSTDPENEMYKEGYQPKVISQGPSVCIFKQDDPQEVLASWLFVKYLTTSVNYQAALADATGYVPVISSVFEHPTYKNYLAHAEEGNEYIAYLSAKVCMEQEECYFTSPAFNGSSQARDMVGAVMYSVFSGSETIDSAFKYAVSECERIAKS